LANWISSMTRDEIIATIRKNTEAIKAEGVTKTRDLWFEGSVATIGPTATSMCLSMSNRTQRFHFSTLSALNTLSETPRDCRRRPPCDDQALLALAERIADDIVEVF